MWKVQPVVLACRGANSSKAIISKRTMGFSGTGAVLPEPTVDRFGMFKVLLAVIPFLYIGATIGKEGAAFMEENDIFVPDDDDDD